MRTRGESKISCYCFSVFISIFSRRLQYSEVVEAQSNYKKYYLWWFKNPACSDWTRSNWIEKDQVGVTPGFVRGKWKEEVVWFSVCEASLDDWTDGGSVDAFFTYEWVWF